MALRRFPQWHGLARMHFPPSGAKPHGSDGVPKAASWNICTTKLSPPPPPPIAQVVSSETTASRSCCQPTFVTTKAFAPQSIWQPLPTFIFDDNCTDWQAHQFLMTVTHLGSPYLRFQGRLHTLATSILIFDDSYAL